MKSSRLAAAVVFSLACAWVLPAEAQVRTGGGEAPRTPERKMSGVRSSAGGGSVRFHKPASTDSIRRPVARNANAPDTRNESVRSRSAGVNRNYAGTGSVSQFRPAVRRPVQWPAHVSNHEVRVRNYPRYGARFAALPAGHRLVTHRGHNYYFCDGVYYRPYGPGAYLAVRPPIGFRLTHLPYGYVSVFIGGQPFYRYGNTYYVYETYQNEPSYVVVRPPSEAYLDQLPPDCHEVIFHGRQYYVDIYEEIAYEPVFINGVTRYRPSNLDVDVDFDDGRVKIELDD